MSTETTHPALSNGATYLKTIQGSSMTMGNSGVSVSSSTVGQSGVTPLAPQLVTATDTNGVITVSMAVYIDVDDSINSLAIYEKPTVDTTGNGVTTTTKPLYVVYDCPEYDTGLLYEYIFSFTISDSNNSIDVIETYLEDTDPVTSRGTVTTVKKTTSIGADE